MTAPHVSNPQRTTPGLAGPPRATGAAVVPDLYKDASDPAAAALELRGEARKLGLAFFVFFSLIIGGLSLVAFNGALKRGHVATLVTPAGQAAAEAALTAAQAEQWLVAWSGGQRTQVERVDLAGTSGDDVSGRDAARLTRVRVHVLDAAGGRRELAALYVTPVQGARVTGLELPGAGVAPTVRSFTHAMRTAKLARLVPTHYVISIGALMGLLGALVPALLVPFYRFWMGYVAAPLGWFNTRLILGLVFFLMVTPMAAALWLWRLLRSGADPLRRAEQPGSYWRRRAQPRARSHFERTF